MRGFGALVLLARPRASFGLVVLVTLLSGCSLASNFGDFKFTGGDGDAGTAPDGSDGTPGGDGLPGDGDGDGDPLPDAGPAPDPLCEAETPFCSSVATCTSESGVAVCSCPGGYFDVEGNGHECADLNECRAATDECDDNAVCMNTPGSYECICNPGFVWDASSKKCLDSCLVALSTKCDPEVGVCTKPDGEAVCRCPAGYMDVAGDGSRCDPDPGCMALGCDPLAECDSTMGPAACVCPRGFSGDGQTCTDIDECATGMSDCHADATCTNTKGGYACTCQTGFQGTGRACEDIDECATEADSCSENGTCTNTRGAYTCACKAGFMGDGFACTDIDECRTGAENCDDAPAAMCSNTPGSYTCMCPAGYSGTGQTQTGCCTPDGNNTDVTHPNDGKDNDCDGKVDVAVIRPGPTFPLADGATSAAYVSIAVQPSSVAGATLQCRHFKRSATPGAFATCAAPVTNPATSTSAANNGAWRTEIRWLFPSGAVSASATHDYYVHNSLHGAPKCTSTVTDAKWFELAAQRLAAPDAGTFVTSGARRDTFTTLPFVRATYVVPAAGSYNSDDVIASILNMGATHTVEMLSLRKRFAVSADGKYLLITRMYGARGPLNNPNDGSTRCNAFNLTSHDSIYPSNVRDKTYNDYTCDVVVLNRSGAGVCLNHGDRGRTTAVFGKGYGDTLITRLLGYANTNKFMWRELVQRREKGRRMRNFTTKCYSAANCGSTYLPDRTIFP